MKKKPNLIFVFADQLRAQALGYAGDQRALTPNLDGFAREGANFTNAISGHPVCGPYRASLLTGMYASTHGSVTNELRVNPDPTCFAHALTAAGYQTAYIGKWHLWSDENENRHLDENQYTPPGRYRLGFDDYWAAYNFNHNYYTGFYFQDGPERISVEGFEPNFQADLTITQIERMAHQAAPFALFLSLGAPHDPFTWDNVPREFADQFREVEFPLPENYRDGECPFWAPEFDRAWWMREVRPNLERYHQVYYALTANLDWNMGRILRALERIGLRDETLFVFTSDHGEMFGAHGRLQKNIFYEEACRVPFLIRWPGTLPAGIETDVCLDTPDIMPTLLSLLGLPIPQGVEGMDLSHCARGVPGPEPEAAFLQGMTGTHWRFDNGFEWRALRDKRYTYGVMRSDRSEYLFDHGQDPLQLINLVQAPEYQPVLERYQAMLNRRMAALNDTFESAAWYRDHWTVNRQVIQGAKG